MLVDLHTHSTFSDGRYTPAQLVQEAMAKGLTVLAITDHDSWNGVGEAQKVADSLGGSLRIIPGVELGAQYAEDSVHILAYYVDMTYAPLLEKMNELRHAREFRLLKMLEKMHNLGYEIEVEACDPNNRAVGRPHVAKALVAKGYFETVQDVFDALLHRGGPAYVPQPKLAPDEAVGLIHKAGGIAVLAHPSELSDGNLPEYLVSNFAFDGIEVYHPSADEADQEKWLALAKKYNILVSGGSDFHGISDRFPTELGIFEVEWQNVAGVIQYKEK